MKQHNIIVVGKHQRRNDASICMKLRADAEAIQMILNKYTTYQELWAQLFFRFGLGEKGYGESDSPQT